MTLARRNATRRRRRLLRAGLAAAAAVVIAIAGVAVWLWSSAAVSTAGKISFTHRLAIPPLAPSRTDAAGQRVFDLRAGEGSKQFRSGPATPTWGINGDYLGPTLRAARGEKVMIHVQGGAAATIRAFDLGGNTINGKGMDMGRIDFTARAGTTQTWQVANRDGLPHNFHIHGVQFRVLSVDGAAPPAGYEGWQDTIYLRPGGTARIAVPFGAYADPRHPYMYHCHLLYHEDQGMMGQFTVTRPGQATVGRGQPQPSPGTGHQH